MDRAEEFKTRLEELLKEYGFNLSAGDMGSEIDLQDKTRTLGYWEGSIPGRFVKW
jgi:hypothetical protein